MKVSTTFIPFFMLFAQPLTFAFSSHEMPTGSNLVANTVACAEKNAYPKPITTYCSFSDYQMDKPHFLVGAIEDILDGEPILNLKIAFFAFSDLNSAYRLCNLLSSQTRGVSVSVQKDTRSENTLDFFSKCAASKGELSFAAFFHGLQIGGINTYHPKLVYIETPDRSIALIGSGNLSPNRKNPDYAIVTSVRKNMPVKTAEDIVSEEQVNWTKCVLDHLNAPTFDSTREGILRIRAACQTPETTERFYLLPGDARRLLSSIGFFTGQARTLRLVSQGFNSPDIDALIRLALREGISVELLVDDDMHWANIFPQKTYMNEQYEYIEHLEPLIRAGAKVRYVITNHNDAIGNFQHAKGISLTNDRGTVAFLGSANLTSSAFADNVETMIQVRGEVARAFNAWFDALWERSIESDAMPLSDPYAHSPP